MADSTTRMLRLKAYREQAGVDWVQLESPHSVEEIKAGARRGRRSVLVHEGQAPRYLGLDEHLALGVTIAWYPGFTHHVIWAALWDFMTDFQERGIAAWDDFVASRKDRPYPHPGCRRTARAPTSSGCWKSAICRTRRCAKYRRGMMARDGYRIFDSDTHVGPDAAILERYLSAADKDRLAGWAEYKSRPTATAMSPTRKASAATAAGSATPSRMPRLPATWPASPASSATRDPRRWSMPTPPRASPTWISRAST